MQWGLANHWSELRIAEGSRDGLRGARGPRAPSHEEPLYRQSSSQLLSGTLNSIDYLLLSSQRIIIH
jgi:hypothetical protein